VIKPVGIIDMKRADRRGLLDRKSLRWNAYSPMWWDEEEKRENAG
jgi:hypothetical protein